MITSEQIWFVVAMGGTLTYLQAGITLIVYFGAKIFKRNIKGVEVSLEALKMLVGVIIFVIALVYLSRLPAA